MIKYLLRIKYNSDEYWIGPRTLHKEQSYSTVLGLEVLPRRFAGCRTGQGWTGQGRELAEHPLERRGLVRN